MFGKDQGDQVANGVYEPTGPRYRFHVAGVVRLPQDITLDEGSSLSHGSSAVTNDNGILVSNAFYEKHRHEFLSFGTSYQLRLRGPATRARVEAAIGAGSDDGAPQVFTAEDNRRVGALHAPVDLETTALLALGIGLAVAGAIVVGLVLRAEQRNHEDDTPALRALGSSAPQLGLAAAFRTLPAALGGAALALVVALGLSPRFPIGIGRQLELDRGLRVNVAVVAVGLVALLGSMLVGAFLVGRPRRAREDAAVRRAPISERLAQGGAPTDLVLGSYVAFARARGARSVPSRQTIAGGALMLALVTGLAVFVGGVDRLYSVPAAHGWAWDAVVGNVNFPLDPSTAHDLARDPQVAGHTRANYGQATVNGSSTEFLAFDPDGTAPPEVLSGRLPRSAGEIALGANLMDRLDAHVGSSVTFSVADGEFDAGGKTTPQKMTVVGETITPVFGESDIGDVGVVTLGGIAAAGGNAGPTFETVRLQPGHRAARLAVLDRHYTEEIVTDAIPAQIVNLHRVRRLPLIGVGVAGVLGVLLLLYVLALTVRVRTRDLAVLRALGLPSRRLRHVLGWEAVLLASAMLVVGVPLGLVAGSFLWDRVVEPITSGTAAVVPALLLLIVPLVLLAALASSRVAARRAGRRHVSEVLRAQ
jgi:hypothetical protein